MPTRRGLLVAAVGAASAAAGAAYGVEEFVLVALAAAGALVAALVAASVSSSAARRGLRAEVWRPAAEASVGDDVSATLVLTDVGAARLPVVWIEGSNTAWRVSLPGFATGDGRPRAETAGTRARQTWRVLPSDERVPVPSLEPGGRAAVALRVPTERRGLWSLAPRRIWCADPFGLVVREVTRSPALHIVVCPVPAHAVSSSAPVGLVGRDPTIEAHGHTRRSQGGGDELAGLRAYAAGDRLTRLHWPALARTGDLVVREFVEPEARRVQVTVDDRPVVVDGAVSRAARLGIDALDAGAVVDLVTTSGHRLRVAPGPSARRALLQALAVVAPATQWRR